MRQSEPVTTRGTLLVAVDGTRAGVDALVWGLRHAAHHDVDVEVLTVWPGHRSVLVHEVPGHFCAPRWEARRAQEETIREATRAVPEAPVAAATLENADATEAIVRASAHHDLVVLGSRPTRARHRLTDRVIADAKCDVVVVDGSPMSAYYACGRATGSRHRAPPHREGAPS